MAERRLSDSELEPVVTKESFRLIVKKHREDSAKLHDCCFTPENAEMFVSRWCPPSTFELLVGAVTSGLRFPEPSSKREKATDGTKLPRVQGAQSPDVVEFTKVADDALLVILDSMRSFCDLLRFSLDIDCEHSALKDDAGNIFAWVYVVTIMRRGGKKSSKKQRRTSPHQTASPVLHPVLPCSPGALQCRPM
jgi:hypothetical protein